ncbi:hypothetical protein CEXT_553611 [Caerostris extrusa]|uniref:Uncharacterized protein n=1 Tax=Caerostris extrusa TaxID=172846 RepID=A0AAV4Q052_CAEEX|nr:hypothetical protein CEXT_553611 [Caerostris extrusa]
MITPLQKYIDGKKEEFFGCLLEDREVQSFASISGRGKYPGSISLSVADERRAQGFLCPDSSGTFIRSGETSVVF